MIISYDLSGTKKHQHIDMIFHMLLTLPILVKRWMLHGQHAISKTTISKWIMTTALRHIICHSTLSICVWCSQWLFYLTLRKSWSPELQTAPAQSECSKMELRRSLWTREFTHRLGQIVQGQTEILGQSHHWLLQAREVWLSFFNTKNQVLNLKT